MGDGRFPAAQHQPIARRRRPRRANRFRVVLIAAVAAGTVCAPGVSAQAQSGPLWARRYNSGVHMDDDASATVVSADGTRVFVAETSKSPSGASLGTLIAYSTATGAQLWIAHYARPERDSFFSLTADPTGSRIFVTGGRINAAEDLRFAVVAYDSVTGAREWTASRRGFAVAGTTSSNGTRLFVTGYDNADRAVTVAYDAASGAVQWTSVGAGPHFPVAIRTSPDDTTVFVLAESGTFDTSNYVTTALSASDGHVVWNERYDGPAHSTDLPVGMAVSPDGNHVVVTGWSTRGNTSSYVTIAYDPSTGARQWLATYLGPGEGQDRAAGIAMSADGSQVFVTGTSFGAGTDDYATVAYNTGTGAQRWAVRYNGPANQDDTPTAIAARPDGSGVVVTGNSNAFDKSDSATIEYNAFTGDEITVDRYDTRQLTGLTSTALAIDPGSTRAFVTGSSRSTHGRDVITAAYAL